jgi:hypothetical protein
MGKFIALGVAFTFLLIHILCNALIMNANPGTENGTGDNFNLIYIKPWTRIGPFAVGLLVGFLIYLNRKYPTTYCLNRVCIYKIYSFHNFSISESEQQNRLKLNLTFRKKIFDKNLNLEKSRTNKRFFQFSIINDI